MCLTNPVDAPWEPFAPVEVAELFRPLSCPWWIAGGYAIEYVVGRPFRPHGDIDVLILRRDQAVVRDFLADWDVWAADPPGTLRRWDRAETLSEAVHDVWVRRMSTMAWQLQLMLDEAEGDEWVARRDPRIRRPVTSLTVTTAPQIPFLRPEVILFYKGRAPRAKDWLDLEMVWPLLNPRQRTWLVDAVSTAYGTSSPWYSWLIAMK